MRQHIWAHGASFQQEQLPARTSRRAKTRGGVIRECHDEGIAHEDACQWEQFASHMAGRGHFCEIEERKNHERLTGSGRGEGEGVLGAAERRGGGGLSMGLIILDDVFVIMRLESIAATPALAWRRNAVAVRTLCWRTRAKSASSLSVLSPAEVSPRIDGRRKRRSPPWNTRMSLFKMPLGAPA